MISQKQLLLRKIKDAVIITIGGGIAFAGIGTWTGNEKFHRQFLNPILNVVDPELSHKAAIFIAKYQLNKAAPVYNPPELETNISGLNLLNPIGLAAGFDKNAECIPGALRFGLGWVEIGSVTPQPQEGNPKPRVFRLPQDEAVINRYGFNSEGIEVVKRNVQQYKHLQPATVVGINLGANKTSTDRIKDYCEGIQAFSDNADYFVINVSSPNTPNLRSLQQSESLDPLLRRVIAVRDQQPRRVPLFLKISPDLEDADVKRISTIVSSKSTRVDALIISNTTIAREGLKSDSSLIQEVGGLSGVPLEKKSTELVAKFYKELKGQVPIIGVGGVSSGQDAFNKISAGASAIQMYTALVYNGPGVVHRIKLELSQILRENGFKSVQDAVGCRHKSFKDR